MPHEPTPFDAHDPDSDRLTREDVMSIHMAHLAGTGWETIAAEHNTTRKNVTRIVQGRRWRNLHPNVSPELYINGQTKEDPAAEIIKQVIDHELGLAGERILYALRNR